MKAETKIMQKPLGLKQVLIELKTYRAGYAAILLLMLASTMAYTVVESPDSPAGKAIGSISPPNITAAIRAPLQKASFFFLAVIGICLALVISRIVILVRKQSWN